ncbi:MAG: hypothetical protein M3444_21455 [Acidobacteriota bacterium]|nr:hypothetical protein [Acidobacteriota bacterium]
MLAIEAKLLLPLLPGLDISRSEIINETGLPLRLLLDAAVTAVLLLARQSAYF